MGRYENLRAWAEAHAPVDLVQAKAVLRLLADYERVQRLAVSLAERVAAQSELLTEKARRA